MRPKWDSFGNLEFDEPDGAEAAARGWLAEAKKLHKQYVELLDDWTIWLRKFMRIPTDRGGVREEAPNVAGVQLDYAIYDALRIYDVHLQNLQRKGTDISEFPDANELESKLGGEFYKSFHSTILQKRSDIELVAKLLTALLASDDFIEEFDMQPWFVQLEILADISERLHECKNGHIFLRDQLSQKSLEVHGNVPIFHPIRLHAISGKIQVENFRPVALIEELLSNEEIPLSAGIRQASTIEASYRYYYNLLPIIVSFDVAEVSQFFIDWFAVFVFHEDWPLRVTRHPLEFRSFLVDLDLWDRTVHPRVFELLGPSTQLFKTVLALTQVFAVIHAIREEESALNKLALIGTSLADLVLELESVAAGVWRMRTRYVGFLSRDALFLVFTGVLDGLYATSRGVDHWQRGQYDALVGTILSGVGGYATVYLGTILFIEKNFLSQALIDPPVFLAALFISTSLKIAGEIVIELTKEGPLEKWFEYNFFGEKWALLPDFEPPNSLFFRWKSERTGRPRISRQMADLFSIFFPLYRDNENDRPPENFVGIVGTESTKIGIMLKPTFLNADSTILVLAINGRILSPIYRVRAGDLSVPIGAPVTDPPSINWNDNGAIESWFIVFEFPNDAVPEAIEIQTQGVVGLTPSELAPFEEVQAFPTTLLYRRTVVTL